MPVLWPGELPEFVPCGGSSATNDLDTKLFNDLFTPEIRPAYDRLKALGYAFELHGAQLGFMYETWDLVWDLAGIPIVVGNPGALQKCWDFTTVGIPTRSHTARSDASAWRMEIQRGTLYVCSSGE